MEIKSFRKSVKKIMDEWRVPGLAIAIVKDKKVYLAEGFGFRDIQKQTPVTPDTIFAIASCTKAFTTFALGILVDEGKLNWDAAVREYFPEFKMYDPVATERITVRDLITHRSGLPRHDAVWYGASFSRKELLHRLAFLKPSKDIRYVYQYQNLMYTAAGFLIECVTGMSWEEFVQRKIFEPLGMTHSNFSVKDTKNTENFALPYRLIKNRLRQLPFLNIDALGPAGSINSSVSDMAKWLLLHLNNGKWNNQQIISPETLKEIHSPQMVINEELKYDELLYPSYAMGWNVQPFRGLLLLRHSGHIDGFSAMASFMPQKNIGVVVLTNLSNTPVTYILTYTIYDSLLGVTPADWNKRFREEKEKERREHIRKRRKLSTNRIKNTKPSHPISDYTGKYEHPGYGTIIIEKHKQSLVFQFNLLRSTMKHYHYDTFLIEEKDSGEQFLVTFHTDARGKITNLSIPLEPAVDAIIFKRTKN